MLKKILNIIILIGLFISSFSQDTIINFGDENEIVQHYLGFRIIPTGTGVVRYVVVYAPNGKIETSRGIPKTSFLNYAYGRIKSETNPKKINLFTKYGVRSARTTEHLWRIRYRSYPFFKSTADTVGWSANITNPYMPSKKQMEYLKNYGIENISDIFWGTNCFRLLKDMENPMWRKNYINENF